MFAALSGSCPLRFRNKGARIIWWRTYLGQFLRREAVFRLRPLKIEHRVDSVVEVTHGEMAKKVILAAKQLRVLREKVQETRLPVAALPPHRHGELVGTARTNE